MISAFRTNDIVIHGYTIHAKGAKFINYLNIVMYIKLTKEFIRYLILISGKMSY